MLPISLLNDFLFAPRVRVDSDHSEDNGQNNRFDFIILFFLQFIVLLLLLLLLVVLYIKPVYVNKARNSVIFFLSFG